MVRTSVCDDESYLVMAGGLAAKLALHCPGTCPTLVDKDYSWLNANQLTNCWKI